MKKSFLLALLFIIVVNGSSQILDTIKLSDNFKTDFSIPDMPAFKALGTVPTNILKPSDLKEFSYSLGAFQSGDNFILPNTFAMEIAPWRIRSKQWRLDEYSSDDLSGGLKRLGYNSSFSLGTNKEDKKKPETKVAIGYRFSFIPKKSNPIIDASDELHKLVDEIQDNRTTYLVQWRKDNNIDISEYDTKKQKEFNEYFDQILKDSSLVNLEYFKTINNKYWNATRFDVAVAWVGASPDSLVENVSFNSFSVWGTAAIRPGKNNTHSQILIGGSSVFNMAINDTTNNFYIGNFRWYEGNKNFKGFIEYQHKYETYGEVQKGLVNIGAEIKVKKNLWFLFTCGIENLYGEDPKSQFVSSINLSLGFDK